MSCRGVTVRDIAARMDGDPLVNRTLISAYLDHPTGDIGLGPAIAYRLGQALGLSGDFLLDLERQHASAEPVDHRSRVEAAATAPAHRQ